MYGKILKTVAIAAGVVALNCVGWFAKPGERPEPRPFISFRPPFATNLTDVNTTFVDPQPIITLISEPQPEPQPEPAITTEDVYEIVLVILPLLAQILTQVTQEAVTKVTLQSLPDAPQHHNSALLPGILPQLTLILGILTFWRDLFRDLLGLLSKVTEHLLGLLSQNIEYRYFAEAGMRDWTPELIRQSGLFANSEDLLIREYLARGDLDAAGARLAFVKREGVHAGVQQQLQVIEESDAVGGTRMVEAVGENEEESAPERRAIESREDVEKDASGPSEAAEEPRPAPLSPAKIEEKPQEGVEEVRTETAEGRSDVVEESSVREIPGAFSESVEAGKREEKEEPQDGSEGVPGAFSEKNKDEEEVVEEAVPEEAPVVEGEGAEASWTLLPVPEESPAVEEVAAEASWTLPAVEEVVEGPQAASSSAFLGERGMAVEKGEAEVLADVEGNEGEKQHEQHVERGKGKEEAVEDADFIFKKIDYGAPIKRIGSRHKTVTARRRRGQDSGQTESSTSLSSVAMFPHDPSTSRLFSFEPPNPAGRAGTFRPFPVVESTQHEEQPPQRLEAIKVAAGAELTELPPVVGEAMDVTVESEHTERPPVVGEAMDVAAGAEQSELPPVVGEAMDVNVGSERTELPPVVGEAMDVTVGSEHTELLPVAEEAMDVHVGSERTELPPVVGEAMDVTVESEHTELLPVAEEAMDVHVGSERTELPPVVGEAMDVTVGSEHTELLPVAEEAMDVTLGSEHTELPPVAEEAMDVTLGSEHTALVPVVEEVERPRPGPFDSMEVVDDDGKLKLDLGERNEVERQREQQELQLQQQQRIEQQRQRQHEPRAPIPGAFPEETGLTDEDLEQDEQQQDLPPPMRPDYCIEGVDLSVSAGDAEILDCLFDERADQEDQGERVEDVVGGEASQDVEDDENNKDPADDDHEDDNEDDNEDEQPNDQGEPQQTAVLIYAGPDNPRPVENVQIPQPYTGTDRRILPARLRRNQRADIAMETGAAGRSAGFSPGFETGFGFGNATDEPEAERPAGMDVDEGITGLADELNKNS